MAMTEEEYSETASSEICQPKKSKKKKNDQ